MNQFKTFGFVVVAAFLSACSSSSGGSSGVRAASVVNSGPAVTLAQLNGNWQSLCGISYVSNVTSEQYVLSFNLMNQASVTVNAYSTSDCSGPVLLSTVVNGSFSLAGLDPSVSGATNLVYAPVSAMITPASADEAAALTSEAYCGMTNWAAGVAQAVGLANSCLIVPLANNQIVGVQNGELFFGNSDDTEINTHAGYSKF